MVPRSCALRTAKLARTFSVAGVIVWEGITESQFTPLSVLVVTEIAAGSPLLVTLRDNGSGVDPGELALNVSGGPVMLMTGSAVAWKFTFTVVGKAFGPMGFTVIVPLYTPGASKDGSTITVIIDELGHPM